MKIDKEWICNKVYNIKSINRNRLIRLNDSRIIGMINWSIIETLRDLIKSLVWRRGYLSQWLLLSYIIIINFFWRSR